MYHVMSAARHNVCCDVTTAPATPDREKLTGEFFFLPSRIYDERVTVSAEAGCVCIRYNGCRQENQHLLATGCATMSMSRIRDFIVRAEPRTRD